MLDAAGLETTRRLQLSSAAAEQHDRSERQQHPRALQPHRSAAQTVRCVASMQLGNATLGGTEAKPEISFDYDFLHFERTTRTRTGQPIFVHTTRRIHHASDNLSDDTIEAREYSDGYGRLIQTRAQAEEWIFGATGDDVGLPRTARRVPKHRRRSKGRRPCRRQRLAGVRQQGAGDREIRAVLFARLGFRAGGEGDGPSTPRCSTTRAATSSAPSTRMVRSSGSSSAGRRTRSCLESTPTISNRGRPGQLRADSVGNLHLRCQRSRRS